MKQQDFSNQIPLGNLAASMKRGLSSNYIKDGKTPIRLIQIKDINESGKISVHLVETRYVSITNTLDSFRLLKGDVILSLKGQTHQAACIDEQTAGFFISSNLFSIRCDNRITPEYLVAYLNSESGLLELEKRTAGAVMMTLNQSVIKDLPVPVPSKQIQAQISEIFRLLQEYRNIVQQEEHLIEKIQNGLFHFNR